MGAPVQVRCQLLEEQRKEALFNGNAIQYYEFCEELGVEPEFRELYEQGLAEKILNNSKNKRLIDIGFSKYENFYRETRNLNIRDFGADIEIKRELLKKYFLKFRKDGRQPIDKMEDLQVGCLFKKITEYCKKGEL